MSRMGSYEVTPAALRPLMRAFWSAEGWRLPPSMPVGTDLDRAVDSGVMFDEPLVRDHDGWVDAARRAARAVTLDEVSDAFISSLASRRLDLRSALGSYAVARHLPQHAFEPDRDHRCRVCGQFQGSYPEELNVLSFERFKWGGVRRDDIRYAAFDLDQFQRAPREPVDDASVALGVQLLDALRRVGPRETATSAVAGLRMIAGNVAERSTLLDILGVCGVLGTAEHPGYRTGFVRDEERRLPPYHYVDRSYPVCWWRGSDGVNDAAVRTFLRRLA